MEIERKKRLYATLDVAAILRAHGIDFSQPIPASSSIPLESFDDEKYEVRTLEEWLHLGTPEPGPGEPASQGQCCVPGCALRMRKDGTGDWVECRMLAWDAAEARFVVRFVDTQREAQVSRLHLMFLAEDPHNFASRVVAAYSAMGLAERRLRYSLYVDCMPTEDLKPLNSEQVTRILNSAINTDTLKQSNLDTTGLVEEVPQPGALP